MMVQMNMFVVDILSWMQIIDCMTMPNGIDRAILILLNDRNSIH